MMNAIWNAIFGSLPSLSAGTETVPVFIPVKVEEIPETMVVALDHVAGKEFHMSLDSFDLAAIYALKDWRIAQSSEGDRTPTARELLTLMLNLAEELDSPGQCLTLGRMMAYNDAEYPGTTDFYLHVGHMDTDGYEGGVSVDDFE